MLPMPTFRVYLQQKPQTKTQTKMDFYAGELSR
jgi:hypothetical protein